MRVTDLTIWNIYFNYFMSYDFQLMIFFCKYNQLNKKKNRIYIDWNWRHAGGEYLCQAQNGVGGPARRVVSIVVQCKLVTPPPPPSLQRKGPVERGKRELGQIPHPIAYSLFIIESLSQIYLWWKKSICLIN